MTRFQGHYGASAFGSRYDTNYCRVFRHRVKIAEEVRSAIDFRRGSSGLVIADIGGGTGDMIAYLKGRHGGHHYVLVEPYLPMIEEALKREHAPDEVHQLTAERFVEKVGDGLDVVICKEMIHHVDRLPVFLRRLRGLLTRRGKIVIVTRPTRVEFPFGKNGRRTWRDIYGVVPSKIPAILRGLGFQVSWKVMSYPIVMRKERWCELIGALPFFSNIAMMSIEERLADIEEISNRDDLLKFNDRVIFITATK